MLSQVPLNVLNCCKPVIVDHATGMSIICLFPPVSATIDTCSYTVIDCKSCLVNVLILTVVAKVGKTPFNVLVRFDVVPAGKGLSKSPPTLFKGC